VGYPLVRAGTHLHTPGAAVYARNARAAEGYAQWADYAAPESGFEEQVYFHQVKAGTDGWTEVALLNEDVGLTFQWDTTSAPYLTQWKNTRQSIYVNGVEPGNCIPEGQQGARASGRLVTLEPGAAQAFHLKLTGLAGDALTAARDRIDALKLDGSAAAGCNLDDFAQQQGA
jgi:hypothetical protein